MLQTTSSTRRGILGLHSYSQWEPGADGASSLATLCTPSRALLPHNTSAGTTHPVQAGWLLRRAQLGEPGGEILLGALKQIQKGHTRDVASPTSIPHTMQRAVVWSPPVFILVWV